MSPSTDTDGSPVWSPDSRRVAFVRQPYQKRRMIFLAVRTAQPWSIQVADVATGEAREVFRAAPGTGSAFWPMQAETQILWSADNRLVFPWERDGFLHLYSVAANGGSYTQLDRGPHEVEYVTLDRSGTHVLFNSNQGDRDRRHVWRVKAAGGEAATAITAGPSIEWLPTPLADGSVAFLRSDARVPAHASIMPMTGSALAPARFLAPQTMSASYPSTQLVVPTSVEIKAADGIESHAQLFLPPAGQFSGKRPAIIFLHGGSRRQMLLGWNYGSYYHHAYAMNQALALRGWVVLSLNYRSGIGYGRDFREALNYGAGGAAEYGDVAAAARWLRARGDVDTSKVALWGGSYGGYLTAMGLTRNPELFAGGVDVHGVHDWNVGIATFRTDYNPLEDPAATALAFKSSPLSQVQRWKDPVLLVHGDDDRNVRFIETLTLIEKLRAQKVPVEQLVLPDEIHGFLRHESWMRVFESALDFLDRQVLRQK
jgi:dipeptidyl aminopeptidase/acylaminoacyl peptidase